jgi:hypothetical protein
VIASGGGDDYLELANYDPTDVIPVSPSKVRGHVSIDLGAGNDTVDLGAVNSSTGEPVLLTIGETLHVRGGEGDDSLNFLAAQVRGAAVVLATDAGNDTVAISHLDAERAALLGFLGDGNDLFRIHEQAIIELTLLLVGGGDGDDHLEGDLSLLPPLRWFFQFES